MWLPQCHNLWSRNRWENTGMQSFMCYMIVVLCTDVRSLIGDKK